MTLRVLLVEDDRELRATLRSALDIEGYEVFTAASLAEAQALTTHLADALRPAGFDLVLLDLGLPDGEGQQLLGTLRRKHSLPVLVISAAQDDGQKIRLLDAGADDYLVKPFAVGELLARMRVTLRHRGTRIDAALTHYRSGGPMGLEIDLGTRSVKVRSEACHLTPTEFKLLARLVRSAGQVVTHRQLLSDVWGPDQTEQTHYLRLYMAQLRAKLESQPANPRWLLTEPGVGYRLVEPEAEG
ncbi:MAG TPA: response regulator [Ideonella sp.]|uniref:response regulator n=1 Tax=Ideonella sp. TaxID=1929293 RepID=UPI002CEC53D8|nr:response regulator [Ideonella sp.]HSI50349.1 response regulator [Ideonella sp.]